MPLLDERDIRMQVRLHDLKMGDTFVGGLSKGIFPPETAFAKRIICALAKEGIEWAIVDNIHFDRACVGYPHNDAAGIPAPNRADRVNADPAADGGAWVQLQNLWAPTRVSVPFGYQPAWVEYVDPWADPANLQVGDVSRIVAVPAARYEGNEDGRGGYGAFLYEQVMDQYRGFNTDAARPMFVLLHHDGDNFGGGSEGYYNGNFQAMVSWDAGTANYNATTVADYLERFPVPSDAVIHVESGSWAGADAGDAEFKKWLGDPDGTGWSPDRNSWAVLTAAKNVVFTAEDLLGPGQTDLRAILDGTGGAVERAWRFLLAAQASDHWYWDGTEVWDSNVTVGSNRAVFYAMPVVQGGIGSEANGPTVFVPQREPYNPGEVEFGAVMDADFEVWTYVYDVSGLSEVTLRWRVDVDGVNDPGNFENETYVGGAGVGGWNSAAMVAGSQPPRPGYVEAPTLIATRYSGEIAGYRDVLIDYYVEAVDGRGNVTRSDIAHVWVGDGSGGSGGGGGDDRVVVSPDPVEAGEMVMMSYDANGGPLDGAGAVFAHVGFDGWSTVVSPDVMLSDGDGDGVWEGEVLVLGSAREMHLAFNDGAGTWDNNGGADWGFEVAGTTQPGFMMDGELDEVAVLVAESGGVRLWAGIEEGVLYVATDAPPIEHDRFVLVADAPGGLVGAPWAKGGQVAAWDALIGAESSNGFAGWFDADGFAEVARGNVVEGVIEMAGEFGADASVVAIASVSYGTADGGVLDHVTQVPASLDGDGTVQAGEYALVEVCSLRAGGCCPGDVWGAGGMADGVIDAFDSERVLELLAIRSSELDMEEPAGVVDLVDALRWLGFMEAGCE